MLYTYLDICHVTSKNNNLKLSKNYNLKEIIWSELQKNCCDILSVPAVRSSLQARIFGWFDMYFSWWYPIYRRCKDCLSQVLFDVFLVASPVNWHTIGNIWWVATLSREFEMTGCDQFLSTLKLVVSCASVSLLWIRKVMQLKEQYFGTLNDDIVVSANSCMCAKTIDSCRLLLVEYLKW
jgi:hypothetical protein